MKNRKIYSYAAGFALAFSLIMFCACSSARRDVSSSKVDNSNSTVEIKSNNNSSESANTKKDITPLTMTVEDVLASSAEEREKFNDRFLTVTDGVLTDITSSNVKIKANSWDSAYIVCSGNFSEYMRLSDKVSELTKDGKPLKVEIKGVFVSRQNQDYALLETCVISDLEK